MLLARRFAVLSLILVSAVGCSAPDDGDAKPAKDAGPLEGGVFGGSRPVTLRVPAGYDGSKPAPLVLLLHGYSVSGLLQDIIFHISGYADEAGYLFAAPDGTIDKNGSHFWNATDDCCDFDGTGVDDVGYLTGLIHEIEATYVVDPKRVYLIGHSNGGYMAHRMACDEAPELGAVVSVAGATWKDQSKCNPKGPINVLEVHGDSDQSVLFAGGTDGTHAYPGALETVSDWAAKNGCGTTLDESSPALDLDGSLPGAETKVGKFAACPAGGDVELWTIQGGTHVPNWGPDFPSVIWKYFASHAKP